MTRHDTRTPKSHGPEYRPRLRRISVVDRQPASRWGIRAVLDLSGTFELVATYPAIEDLLDAHLDVHLDGDDEGEDVPDGIILGFDSPAPENFEGLRNLSRWAGDRCILVLSGLPPTPYARRLLEEGAHGFVSKSVSMKLLPGALHAAFAGDQPCLIDRIHVEPEEQPGPGPAESGIKNMLTRLSSREKEVLSLLGAGLSPARIGHHLDVSPKTVDRHRENLKHKLGARSAADLLRIAVLTRELTFARAS